MLVKRFVSQFFLISIVILFNMFILPDSLPAVFKDATPEVNKAAEQFSVVGLFNSFIYNYGMDIFRPDANVTRADLILTLNEYYTLTNKLIDRDTEIMSFVTKLKSRISSSAYKDNLFRGFQKLMEPVISNSTALKSIKQKNILPLTDNVSSLKNEISEIKANMESLTTTINEITPGTVVIKGSSGKSKKDSAKSIEKLQYDLSKIKNDFYKLEKKFSYMTVDIKNFKEEMTDSLSGKKQDNSKPSADISHNKYNKLLASISDIKESLSMHKKDIDKISADMESNNFNSKKLLHLQNTISDLKNDKSDKNQGNFNKRLAVLENKFNNNIIAGLQDKTASIEKELIIISSKIGNETQSNKSAKELDRISKEITELWKSFSNIKNEKKTAKIDTVKELAIFKEIINALNKNIEELNKITGKKELTDRISILEKETKLLSESLENNSIDSEKDISEIEQNISNIGINISELNKNLDNTTKETTKLKKISKLLDELETKLSTVSVNFNEESKNYKTKFNETDKTIEELSKKLGDLQKKLEKSKK